MIIIAQTIRWLKYTVYRERSRFVTFKIGSIICHIPLQSPPNPYGENTSDVLLDQVYLYFLVVGIGAT